MTEPRYTPQMILATLCVLVLPAGIVWTLHANGTLTSFWVSLLVGLALTLTVLTIGTAYWRRRRHPATVLFSELLVWGWIRHQYLDHKINGSLRALTELRPGESARRAQLLTKVAAAVEAKDPFIYGHSRRVARYVTRVGRRMHLDRSEVARFRTAALLHDVGKLYTPPEVLLQPHKLNAEETAVMRRHVEDGAQMVAALGDRDLADVVRHHHERFDGAGYPAGLAGDAIPLGSRVIAVPDTFDAITTTRPYREGLTHAAALTVLRDEAGKQFDPAVVRAFIAEYSDRRGAMIWATAEQLIPALRVAAVALAAVMLSGVAYAASAPRASTQPQVQAAAPLASRGTAGGSGPTRPHASSRLPSRPATAERQNAQKNEAVVAQRGKTQQRAPAPSSPSPSPLPAQPTLSALRSSPSQRTRAPSAPTPPPTQPTRSALAPQAVATYSQVGSSLTDPQAANALTTQQRAEPGPSPPPPTTTTTPTTPTAPPTPTTPAPPTETTTPTPPSNPDQCKNGGWEMLGYKNQGQCIAAANGH